MCGVYALVRELSAKAETRRAVRDDASSTRRYPTLSIPVEKGIKAFRHISSAFLKRLEDAIQPLSFGAGDAPIKDGYHHDLPIISLS